MKRALLALVLAAFVMPAITVLADDDPDVDGDFTQVEYIAQRTQIDAWFDKKTDKNAAKRARILAKQAALQQEWDEIDDLLNPPIGEPEPPPEVAAGLENDAAKIQKKIDRCGVKLDKLTDKETKKTGTLDRQYRKKIQQLEKRARHLVDPTFEEINSVEFPGGYKLADMN